MSSSNNPKSFYNQSEYGTAKDGHQMIGHSGDTSSDLTPPPPYTNGQSSGDIYPRESDGRLQQGEQTGLLGNQNVLSSLKSNIPNWRGLPYSFLGENRIQLEEPRRPRRYCRWICLIIPICILAILSIALYLKPRRGSRFACGGSTESLNSIPFFIEFKDNVEVIVMGHVSGGRILVSPGNQRHEGAIWTDIQYTPSRLQPQFSHRIEQLDNGDLTRLVLNMPQRQEPDDCIQVSLLIDLPYGAKIARFITSNMDIEVEQPIKKELETFELTTSNGDIFLNHWVGESLLAKTTNGNIHVQGSLSADKSIHLETTQGKVTFFHAAIAKSTLEVYNTNGPIRVLEALRSDGSVQLKTTNGMIEANTIAADTILLVNSNGKVNTNHIRAEKSIVVETTNAPIQLAVTGVKNNHLSLRTTNAPVRLHVTHEFEGDFSLETSHSEKVIVKDDPDITFQSDFRYFKQGYRKGLGNKGDLSVKTTNDLIEVSFDI